MVERLSRLSIKEHIDTEKAPPEIKVIVAPMYEEWSTKEIVARIFNIHRPYIKTGQIGFRPAIAYMDAVERGWVLLATINNDIVGFAHYRVRRDNMIRLYAIAVNGDQRRIGIGSAILDRLEQINGDKICTEVRVDNQTSINFFTGRGYKPGPVIAKKNYSVIPFTLYPLGNKWYYDKDQNAVIKTRKRRIFG